MWMTIYHLLRGFGGLALVLFSVYQSDKRPANDPLKHLWWILVLIGFLLMIFNYGVPD